MSNAILRQAQTLGTPLIDGDAAVFVWQGRQAPCLVGDFTEWEREPVALERAVPGVWTYRLPLPPTAYMEYAYVADDRRLPDPLNPRTTPNGTGQVNHYFYMPGGAPTPLARRRRGVPYGTLTRHLLQSGALVGGRRTVHLYRPPAPGPCPLLVVWDGRDYLRRVCLPNVVDNLIAQGRMRPLALALVDNAGAARSVEYACSEAVLGFLMESLLPLAGEHLDLLDARQVPGAHGVLGASMGGLMALFTGLRIPEVFGHVLSQSGAFGFDQHDFVVFDLVRYSPPKPLKVWLDAGRYDFQDLLEANRRMAPLLLERGYDAAYREYDAGHNYPAWRDDVAHGLEHLFGPRA